MRNALFNIIDQTNQHRRTRRPRSGFLINQHNFTMQLSSRRLPVGLINPMRLNNNWNRTITTPPMEPTTTTPPPLLQLDDNTTNFSDLHMNQYMNHNNAYMYEDNYGMVNEDYSTFIRSVLAINTTFNYLNDDFIEQSIESYDYERGTSAAKQLIIQNNSILKKFSNIDNPKNNVCPILYEDFDGEDNVYILKCNHIIHEDKFLDYIKRFDYCPLCKSDL
jgi:predicted nucleic-acid-binding protein